MGKLEQTRAGILDSAWELISREGADVSISRIAGAAGITRQSVYDHFGSRGGLIVAMVRRVDERLQIRLQLFNAFEHPDPRTRLTRTIDTWIAFVKEIYPVATDLIRLRATDQDAANAWEDRMSELRSWLLELTKSLKKDGALHPHWTAKAASEYLWAAFSVQMWGLLIEDCGWSERHTKSMLRRTICRSLLAEKISDLS